MKNYKNIILSILILLACSMAFVSCGDDKNPGFEAPVISFESASSIYSAKVGHVFTLEAKVENDHEAVYSWATADDEILSTTKTLSHSWDKSGSVYITFKVTTPYGQDSKEIRVDVAKLVLPVISLAIPEGGYELLYGKELELKPQVANSGNAEFKWIVNGTEVSDQKDFTFKGSELGAFSFVFSAANEDGEDSIEFKVNVKNPEDLNFSWTFDSFEYNVAKGRMIRLMPFDIENAFDAQYEWRVNGEAKQESESERFIFDAVEEGRFEVRVTMKNSYGSVYQDLTVNVCPAEGKYKRTATASSQALQTTVFEFLPAPGQFVNEGYVCTTPEEAAGYAQKMLVDNLSSFISLGAWGGYVVVGFDHSIENKNGYDIVVKGNPFEGSSEPGIVWVMQDENGDGLPNDTWYELKGSEYGKSGTIQDYSVTYYYPASPFSDVAWKDNLGNSGFVEANEFHTQEYYYPLWAHRPSYTLRGTRLEARSYMIDNNPENWYHEAFDWGYADNFSNIDLTNNANGLRISDAVRFDGQPANLGYIDFVKVQGGVQMSAGWLGEVSTEVLYVKDNNI